MSLTVPDPDPVIKEVTPVFDMTGQYYIHMIIISDGVNHHGKLRINNLDYMQRYGETEYNINSKNLFLITRNPLKVLLDKLKGIKHRFLIVFKKGNSDAVNLSLTAKIPAEILHLASRSGALRSALSELFSEQIGFKKIAFVIIIVGVAFIIYLVQSGKLNLLMA